MLSTASQFPPVRLSPAMRNMLRAAIAGKPLPNGETRAALIARNMLTDAGQPTSAGRMVFAPKLPTACREPAC